MPRTTKKQETEAKATVKTSGLSIPAYTLDGKESATIQLPEKIFGQKINDKLIAQAVRTYVNNQSAHYSNTKTRGEVKGSTRKIRVQKGTGGARHGAVRAPIFVGGGIALGPKSRKVNLDLPKKMKRSALVSILSKKMKDNFIIGLSGVEKATGKTAEVAKLLSALDKKNALILIEGENQKFLQASRNLKPVQVKKAQEVNVFDLIKHQTLILTKDAINSLEIRLSQEKKEESAIEVNTSKAKVGKKAK